LAKARESRQVSAVLRSHERVVASFRLVGLQRAEADDVCAHAEQFCDVVLERTVRPPSATFLERRVHLSIFAASEERQLESDRSACVACVAVLVFLGRVFPAISGQKRGNPVEVF
jgi:hypothetical protein